MKEEYWVFGGALLFQLGILLYRYYQRRSYRKTGEEIVNSNYDSYLELRNETFALKAEDLGIATFDDKETAFALMMEMHIGSALQTLVAFADGTVWIFNSRNARKNIGDSDAADLRLAAIDAMATAQYHFARMRRQDVGALLPGHIKFYILTNCDNYSAGDTIKAILDESSPWTELAKKGFAIGDELNKIAENNPTKRVVYPKTTVKRGKPANF
ncbi:hypothetical protein [Mucilaginibacter celer]|uniref:Uncharacterized protein n=1 Tax=Mucilaginibacter celer TaxID=2305508 RepID=A0A494VKE4_9SPHI|nr:hypothetical protein [Mucilaginibacter celer]AYL94884.1 hypothetical protein HYN43_006015 [Mucilaginibacter celer]